jgi:hypothetical protein
VESGVTECIEQLPGSMPVKRIDNPGVFEIAENRAPRPRRMRIDRAAGCGVIRRRPGHQKLHELGKPFYRVDTARSGPGSGLDLATVARIAAWHGGSLELRNRKGGGFIAEFASGGGARLTKDLRKSLSGMR